MSETEKDARIYELGYWFVPTIAEEAVDAQVTELKNTLTAKGAAFISEEAPYLREIAYEMKKVISNQNHYFSEGYFGWIKFEIDPSEVENLRKEMELDPNIIRSMLVLTVRENTVSTKRPATHKREEEVETEEVVSEDVPAVEEEIVVAEVLSATDSAEVITDDITIIEGLGPKAAEALIAAGVDTFAKLANKTKEEIETILAASESKVQHLDATTWAEQAGLAAAGKMDELKALQEVLNNGREV